MRTLIFLVCFSALLMISRGDYENISDEDSFIMDILRKYDPAGTLYMNRETYEKVLQEVMETGLMLAEQVVTNEEMRKLRQAISDFVWTTKPYEQENSISYKEIYGDLTNSLAVFLQSDEKYSDIYSTIYSYSEKQAEHEQEQTDL